MKIQELRDLAKKADRECLEKAFAESYKQLTKRQKEEADQAIVDILTGKAISRDKQKETVNFEELDVQITEFLQNAYAQNYFAPNRVIPKSQRPKWRFLVKNYIKELSKISVDDDHYARSVKLLTDLYHLLCTACNYYLFSTEDAFRSVGWAQPDLFELVVKRTFGDGYTREKISALLTDSVSGGLSREALHIFQESVLLAELKTSDVKYMAVEEARTLIEDRKKRLKGLKKYDNKRYSLTEEINNLCGMILMTAVELAEPASGIEYYFQNCEEQDKEITLYRALRIMEWIEDNKLWVQVYEYGISKKIKPRENLVRQYKLLTANPSD